jgi:hypothetical protein
MGLWIIIKQFKPITKNAFAGTVLAFTCGEQQIPMPDSGSE